MAPKGVYTAERLRDVGAKAAKAARKKFPDCEFACVYTGDPGAVVCRSQVCFEWRAQVGSCQETWRVEANCQAADRRSVPFPEHWRTAIPCARLRGLASQSAAELRSSVGVLSLSCCVLGVPALAPVPLAGATCVPGVVVQLQARNLTRQDFLLVAHIDGDRRVTQDFLRGREVGARRCNKITRSQVVLPRRVPGRRRRSIRAAGSGR